MNQEIDLLAEMNDQTPAYLKKGERDLVAEGKHKPMSDLELQQEDLNMLQEHFDLVTKEQVSSISYDDLVEHWLPLFVGRIDSRSVYNMSNWTSFAGSEFSYVDVLDRDGNLMFQVPPMYPPQAYVPVNDSVDFKDCDSVNQLMIETSEIAAKQGNFAPVNDVFDVLSNRFSPSVKKKHEEEWKRFFQNMGLWDTPRDVILKATRGEQAAAEGTTKPTAMVESKEFKAKPLSTEEDKISPNEFLFD